MLYSPHIHLHGSEGLSQIRKSINANSSYSQRHDRSGMLTLIFTCSDKHGIQLRNNAESCAEKKKKKKEASTPKASTRVALLHIE